MPGSEIAAAVEKARRFLEIADMPSKSSELVIEAHHIANDHLEGFARALVALADHPAVVPDDEAMVKAAVKMICDSTDCHWPACRVTCEGWYESTAQDVIDAINRELAERAKRRGP